MWQIVWLWLFWELNDDWWEWLFCCESWTKLIEKNCNVLVIKVVSFSVQHVAYSKAKWEAERSVVRPSPVESVPSRGSVDKQPLYFSDETFVFILWLELQAQMMLNHDLLGCYRFKFPMTSPPPLLFTPHSFNCIPFSFVHPLLWCMFCPVCSVFHGSLVSPQPLNDMTDCCLSLSLGL